VDLGCVRDRNCVREFGFRTARGRRMRPRWFFFSQLPTNINSCSAHNFLFYMHSDDFGNDSDDDQRFLPLSDCDSDGVGFQDQTLRAPKLPLRSRPRIDFTGRSSGQHSAIGRPPSHMSGSTLHTGIPSYPSNFPRKATSFLGSSSQLSSEVIESLTESELFLNPLHRKLRQKYDHVSGVLATYLERELAECRVAKGDTLVPDVPQCEYLIVSSQSSTNLHCTSTARCTLCIVFGAKRFGVSAGKTLFNVGHRYPPCNVYHGRLLDVSDYRGVFAISSISLVQNRDMSQDYDK
jgi:hypothetical protein